MYLNRTNQMPHAMTDGRVDGVLGKIPSHTNVVIFSLNIKNRQ